MNIVEKTVIWVLVIGLVVWGGMTLFKKGETNQTNEPIKIGFIGPLTGDAAAVGEPIQNGVKLAVDEINKAGGINGRVIQMVYEDGKCSGKDAASAAQKLITVDGARYMIAGVCSAEAFGFAPIISSAKVFVIMPGASAPKLSGISQYIVRNNPNDNHAGISLADYLAKSYKKVAIISENTDYAQDLKSVFLVQTGRNGLAVVSTEDYGSQDTDFRPSLLKVKETKPDAIFINPQTPANAVRLAQQIRQIKVSVPLVGAQFNDPKTIKDGGSAMEGMVLAVAPGLSSIGKGPEFTNKYKLVYGEESAYPFYSGAAYDGVYLIAQAVSSVGDDTFKVQEYMHSLKNYNGTIGTYSFDQNGDIVGLKSILQKVVNGQVVNL